MFHQAREKTLEHRLKYSKMTKKHSEYNNEDVTKTCSFQHEESLFSFQQGHSSLTLSHHLKQTSLQRKKKKRKKGQKSGTFCKSNLAKKKVGRLRYQEKRLSGGEMEDKREGWGEKLEEGSGEIKGGKEEIDR